MEWEQLRSRARQIESSLGKWNFNPFWLENAWKDSVKISIKDAKLVSFSKIGTSDSSLEVEIDQLMVELGKSENLWT